MKPVIAMTLAGTIVSKEPWQRAHETWFDTIIETTGDTSFEQWKSKPSNYFEGVDSAMKLLYPEKTDEERTRIARKQFSASVLSYIKKHPEVVHTEVIEYLQSLADTFDFAIISSNPQEQVEEVITLIGCTDLFSIVMGSHEEEKDDKTTVLRHYLEKHGKPILYVSSNNSKIIDFCHKNYVPVITNIRELDKYIDFF